MYSFAVLCTLLLFHNIFLSYTSHIFTLIDLRVTFTSFQRLFYLTLFLVRFNILLFSFYYFSSGRDYYRFLLLLLRFILSIAFLIFHKGSILLFLGWDGLGVTSYLLVLFYMNSKRIGGATTTVLTNRLGDVFLFLFLTSIGVSGDNTTLYSLLSIFLILCSFTKRAQAPFSSWLPMAMRAPTPVSSLVHSSTLVTAGLFLLMKYSFFWSSSIFLIIIFGFGLLTIFIASSIALAEKDIKKIIALRTLSQLGFIMTSLGLSSLRIAFFHLITHAYFKRCMFVQVGGIILLNNTSQDGRLYSHRGNITIMASLSIRCLSLCGFPILSGFISKDLVLTSVMSPSVSMLIFIIYVLGVFLTFLYSLRILLYSLVNSSSPYSKLPPPKVYFSSTLILVRLGCSVGWFIFSNLSLPPIHLLFVEKLIPRFYWVLLFLLPYSLLKSFELLGGIFIQDTIILQTQKFPLKNFKILDVFHLYILNTFNRSLHNYSLFFRSNKTSFLPIILGLIILLLII